MATDNASKNTLITNNQNILIFEFFSNLFVF